MPLSYKLRDRDGWKIYDIAIDGISLVTNYRTGFSNKIKADGIDGLIAELREKNAG
ncbi:MAG: ABC transporter substrate-binding protein [Pseudomonadota bacterium]